MVAILQPHIPHYREDFFKGLQEEIPCDLFCYENSAEIDRAKFHAASIQVNRISSVGAKGFLFYNPFSLLKPQYQTLVLMLHFGHITTWLLLLTRVFHRKKIILWGHGISVKRYLKESRKPPLLLRWMIKLSNAVWLYTGKEKEVWAQLFPGKPIVSLNNTISGLESIMEESSLTKTDARMKYDIRQRRIMIFCARFNTPDRRIDLLEEAVRNLDEHEYGFIIIGDGPLKPDFTRYSHVYDFGGLYDPAVKAELFKASDIYFQPGWVGLSVVEGMGYGKPVFTLERKEDLFQCVEFAYITNGYNGRVFDQLSSLLLEIRTISDERIAEMGANSKNFVRQSLTMHHMIKAAASTLK